MAAQPLPTTSALPRLVQGGQEGFVKLSLPFFDLGKGSVVAGKGVVSVSSCMMHSTCAPRPLPSALPCPWDCHACSLRCVTQGNPAYPSSDGGAAAGKNTPIHPPALPLPSPPYPARPQQSKVVPLPLPLLGKGKALFGKGKGKGKAEVTVVEQIVPKCLSKW